MARADLLEAIEAIEQHFEPRLPRPARGGIGNVDAAPGQRSAEQVGFIGRTMNNKLYDKVISKPFFRSRISIVFYQRALCRR
jgi:hypothetical protein